MDLAPGVGEPGAAQQAVRGRARAVRPRVEVPDEERRGGGAGRPGQELRGLGHLDGSAERLQVRVDDAETPAAQLHVDRRPAARERHGPGDRLEGDPGEVVARLRIRHLEARAAAAVHEDGIPVGRADVDAERRRQLVVGVRHDGDRLVVKTAGGERGEQGLQVVVGHGLRRARRPVRGGVRPDQHRLLQPDDVGPRRGDLVRDRLRPLREARRLHLEEGRRRRADELRERLRGEDRREVGPDEEVPRHGRHLASVARRRRGPQRQDEEGGERRREEEASS
jgi:hypothetical protein